MGSSQKKVIVRQRDGEVAWGYLAGAGFVDAGRVHLLDPAGKVTTFSVSDIQWIAYVKDFNLTDRLEPERLGRRTFQGRPRQGGLWVRLTLGREEILEGVAEFDLVALDGWIEDRGLSLTPPDRRSNTMRLFVPRAAIRSLEVLGWIGSPARPAKAVAAAESAPEAQPGLFEE